MFKLIAHRGIHNKEIKENSYDAIYMALQSSKYIGVEFDVRLTLDNEFILYHDAMYNNKLIKNTLYRELPKYVPKLIDVLNIKSDKIFLIEIKNINDKYEEFIKLINKYKNKKIYIMSFSNKIINKLNKFKRNYKLGILNYVLNTDEIVKELDFVCILNSLLNDSIINTLKNKEIFSYGLFEKKEYDRVYYIVDN